MESLLICKDQVALHIQSFSKAQIMCFSVSVTKLSFLNLHYFDVEIYPAILVNFACSKKLKVIRKAILRVIVGKELNVCLL